MACRDATEVTLDLSTDVDCRDLGTTAIFAASDGSVEHSAPSKVTSACLPGGTIGTLVIVPAGDKDQPLHLKIITGIGVPAEMCTDDDPLKQCIVTRRTLAFLPHEGLRLPVSLDKDCRGVKCGENRACRNSQCVDATVDPHTCQGEATGCQPLGGGQGGAGQAGSSSGGSEQGASAGSSGQAGFAPGGAGQGGLAGQGGAAGQSGDGGAAATSGGGTTSGASGQSGAGTAGAQSGAAGQGGAGKGGGQSGASGQSGAGVGGGGQCPDAVSSACGPLPCGGEVTCCDALGNDSLYGCQEGPTTTLYRCLGPKWLAFGTCPGSCAGLNGCQNGTGCTEGARRCDSPFSSASYEERCIGGVWTTQHCSGTQLCGPAAPHCTCNGSAPPGQMSEDGDQICYMAGTTNVLYSCVGGQWKDKTCPSTCDPNLPGGGC